MQYTDNEAALIGGLISTYFFQPAVSASLKDAYTMEPLTFRAVLCPVRLPAQTLTRSVQSILLCIL